MSQVQRCRQCGQEIYFDGICFSCQIENESRQILALTEKEVQTAIEGLCAEIRETGQLERGRDLFEKLVNFRDIHTGTLAEAAFSKSLFSPSLLYKDMPDFIQTALLDRVTQEDLDSETLHLVVEALAVHGGEGVFQAFLDWEKHPAPWQAHLLMPLSDYAVYGGWTFDGEGQFQKTQFDLCYPLVRGTPEEKALSPVKLGIPAQETCAFCHRPLVHLMEIDGRDPRLAFLGIDGVIHATCCPHCLPWAENYFCSYTVHGESQILCEEAPFSTGEERGGEDWLQAFSDNPYGLGPQPVSPRYAACWDGGPSIGGAAFWIQDQEIRHCPHCGRPMQYLAQIPWALFDFMEGYGYVEICRDCQLLSIFHQQT